MSIRSARLARMAVALGWLFACGWLAAQTISGSIVGTITDPTGAAIPEASVRLTASSSGAVRTTTSDARGDFSFNALPPDTYVLTVTAKGFRQFQRSDINLLPNQRVSLATITLNLGPTSEMVTVTGQPPQVHTNDTTASAVITPDEVNGVPIESRNFEALAELLPGVPTVPGAVEQGFRGNVTLTANGQSDKSNSITIDGLATENSNGASPNTFVSEDAVKEVTILQYNYTAKYGRSPGLAVRATTKGGTQHYRGSAYWYQRNQLFNANDTFDNRQHRKAPDSRFFSVGSTFGGPLILPKLLPRQQKLFFFFSGEIQRERLPQSIQNINVPNDGSLPGTSNERAGDFSDLCPAGFNNGLCINGKQTQLVDESGRPYANNNITAFINPAMQKFLNLLPRPNQTPAAVNGNANYFYQESVNDPRHTEFLRLDYDLTPKTILTASGLNWVEDDQGANVPAGSTKWGWLPADYNPASRTLNLSVTHVFSTTLTLEATGSMMYWSEAAHPSATNLARVSRSVQNINIPQFSPQDNPLNLLPLVTFASMPGAGAPNISWDGRFPIHGRETTRNLTVDLTKVLGTHTFDAGFYAEHWYMNKGADGNFAGTFTFEQNTKTYGLSTGNDFADAYLVWEIFISTRKTKSGPSRRERWTTLNGTSRTTGKRRLD